MLVEGGPVSGPGASRPDTAAVTPADVADAALGRLTQLAVRLLGAASAHLSLADRPDQVAGITSLVVADDLCRATADAGAPVVVPDARTDARLAGVPHAADGPLGAYLGVPLVGRDGHPLGALCVSDAHPGTGRTATSPCCATSRRPPSPSSSSRPSRWTTRPTACAGSSR
ncbi:GAF domain-containing protein [Cellulomonas sp. JZ18]|nr:GAF domain-containing protein [Cellulomonas sp. JZ18]